MHAKWKIFDWYVKITILYQFLLFLDYSCEIYLHFWKWLFGFTFLRIGHLSNLSVPRLQSWSYNFHTMHQWPSWWCYILVVPHPCPAFLKNSLLMSFFGHYPVLLFLLILFLLKKYLTRNCCESLSCYLVFQHWFSGDKVNHMLCYQH